MSTAIFIGNAQSRADQHWVRPLIVPNSDSYFILEINNKQIKVKAGDNDSGGTATAVSATGVVQLLKEAIDASDFAEWQEASLQYAYLNNDGVTYTESDDPATMLVLKGPSDGKPLTITCSTSTGLAPSVLVTESTKGVAGQNEKQSISFAVTPSGGTFTLSFAGYTSGNIACDANAATVETEFEGLTSVGAGNGTVTGSAGAWVVEFTGTLAQTNVPLITGSGALLTGAGSVVIATTTQGSGISGVNEIQRIASNPSIQDWWIGAGYSYRLVFTDPNNGDTYYSGTFASPDSSGSNTPAESQVWRTNMFNATITLTRSTGGTISGHNVIGFPIGFTDNWSAPYQFEFLGDWGPLDADPIVLQMYTPYNGTWSDVETATTYQESSTTPVNEVQTITVYKATGGNFTLTFQGQTTGAITYSATPATLASNIQTALVALSNVETGETTVAVSSATAVADIFTCTFSGQYAGVDVAQMTANAAGLTGGTVVISTTQAAIVEVDEVQQISLPNSPSAGTFTLSFGGETTAAIAYDATAGTVDTAIETLTAIGAGGVTVTGDAGGPWTVTFDGSAVDATDQALITGNGYGLTITGTQTMEIHRAKTRRYDSGTWVQSTRVFTAPTGGNPSGDGVVVGDYAQVFRTASVGAAAYMARVSGANATTITLSADVIEGSAPTDGTTNTTLLIVTAPTGPNYWDNVDNWNGGALPVDGDTVVFESSDVDCLYNLTQSLITPAIFRVKASYTGKIGLARDNDDYHEYRPTYLALGNVTDAQTITVEIGQGAGDGSGRIKLNTGTAQTALYVFSTGTQSETNVPAVLWKGTHASNTVDVQKGSFGAAFYADETATIATLTEGYVSNRTRDADVFVGIGVTLTTVDKTGGYLDLWAGFTTLTHHAGELDFRDGAAGTITQYNGTFNYASDGNYTAMNVFGGTVDLSPGEANITGTNTTLYAGAEFIDNSERITFTNPVAVKCALPDLKTLQLGTDITLQRG